MFNKNSRTLMRALWLWFLLNCLNCSVNGQSENAIGAHRAYQKTSFSCSGRPAGYYADIETGCQVYHMCDGLGRQFSYSCPNTTLFQQRMLICDHWYMVNCSKAESDYTANLLIGQRNKPFVNDDETNLRTPRPDLLDRPYAPDYSGESFRNQYKQQPAAQNQITDKGATKNADKNAQASQPSVGQQRWKIPPPSRTILPPAYEPQIEQTTPSSNRAKQSIGPRIISTSARPTTRQYTATTTTTTTTTSTTTTTTTRRPSTTYKATRRPSYKSLNSAALHQRQTNSMLVEQEDLGTSHSTRYNTSGDFNSVETNARKSLSNYRKTVAATMATQTAAKVPIKVPSKIYEPPFLYPIYNENDTLYTSTEKPLRVSTATPFTASPTTRSIPTTTTTRTPNKPTTLAGKPFTFSHTTSTSAPNSGSSQNNLLQSSYNRFDSQKYGKDARTPTPAQGFKPPTPMPPVNSVKTLRPPSSSPRQESSAFDYKTPSSNRLNLPTSGVSSGGHKGQTAVPSDKLLPPFPEFVQHDIATTQGPPIYYEWKAPSNGLEPPKLDPPIGVDGREYPDAKNDYNSVNSSGGFSTPSSLSTAFGIDQQKVAAASSKSSFVNNPFLTAKQTADTSTTRTPTSRSIKETGQPNSVGGPTGATAIRSTGSDDITEIRKELSVPDYAFPLENIGRTGYLDTNTYNSFQLKIPERHSDTPEEVHWFGENPKCPQCHPSYVIPGTCEPCLRR